MVNIWFKLLFTIYWCGILRKTDILSGEGTVKVVSLPSEKVSTQKGKLLPREAISFLLKLTPFQKGLVCRNQIENLSPLMYQAYLGLLIRYGY